MLISEWNGYYGYGGGWVDGNTLELCNRFTYDQEKTHFSLWAVLKTSLFIGCDLTNIKASTLSIISNKNLIEVNQDPLGIPGQCVKNAKSSSPQVWITKMANEDIIVLIANLGNKKTKPFTL